MEEFQDVVSAKKFVPLVITCDWQTTLNDFGWHHLELLHFLSDAKKAGHRVIITSGSRHEFIHDMLDILIEIARDKNLDIVDRTRFELISKQDLKDMNLTIDYAFDNKPISEQIIANYVHAQTELRVHHDFTITPLNLTQLRAICGLPQAPNGNTPNSPDHTRVHRPA